MSNNPIFDEVKGRYNGPQLEQTVLDFWRDQDIFEKTLKQSAGKPRFSFNEGPPTANGKPGIHHVLARTFKDIYPRYKTMRGYYAPRKAGWDTHGLPVEHEIEKQLGIFDKKEIEKQVGISEFTRRCRESVMSYISDWEKMTQRMGYWVNLDQAYYTLDNQYIESTWNLIKRIWDKDLIYKGYKVVPYDPRIGATLSSHEVAQGYREVEDPSITVKFKLADRDDCYFLVWTTTPWTLPTNLLLSVGNNIDYELVEANDETYILASARVEHHFGETPYKIIKTVKGSELVGQRYQRLFDYIDVPFGDYCRVTHADFVSTEEGTGIVHISPGYGADDLALCEKEGLPVIHGVGLDGYFKVEVKPVAGLFFKEADAVINQLLHDRGLMFKDAKTRHNYPFGWRTGDPLIYYAKEAWYIRTTQIKDQMVALNKTIHWVPETIKDGRFGNWLENNIDWALSRERFWGTPLPVWTDGEGDFICVGSLQELQQLTGLSLANVDLHRPQIDDIQFEKDGKQYRRVAEVIDCWFDSGAMSYAQWHYPFENEEQFNAHFPADYICEAIDQTRGWFYTLHAIAALVDDSVAYKNCVCLSHIVDQRGKKMSKSQGNIIDPYEVFDTVGVDALRWLFLARTAPDAQKRISIDIIKEVIASFVNTLWNTYAFFILYARLDNIDFSKQVTIDKRPEIDRWILALTHKTIREVTTHLENYEAFNAGQAIERLTDQLSNWYIRRNRRRFWKSDDGDDKQSAYLTLYESLDTIQKLIAPFMPFLSEIIYRNLSKANANSKESVHLDTWPEINSAYLDDKLVFEMDVIQEIVGLGRAARERSRVRIRQPLSRLLVSCRNQKQISAIEKHQQQIIEELNIKSIEFIDSDASLISYSIKPNFPVLGKKYGSLVPAIKQTLAESNNEQIVDHIQNDDDFEIIVNGETLKLTKEDVTLLTSSAKGFACSSAEDYLVALDISITEELHIEGIARELVRTIQEARKSVGLDVSDRITLHVEGSNDVVLALEHYKDHIMSETLSEKLAESIAQQQHFDHQLGDTNWRIRLERCH